ncbi:hypothetical protein SPFL3102_03585 [Sporomusaceae bacterium FL31]|nr:hypothetical protein SPFL3101_00420 [Sporomusaceae bacterium FL31]GCE35734.1 hypothetical protein SPFL3102_03585 [Sporomusaceae bacterium]
MSKPYYELAEKVSSETGIPAAFVWAQWAHESQGFTSRLAKENFNFGGVTQEAPNGEANKQPDGGNYYKKFDSPEEYASFFSQYIRKYNLEGATDSIDKYASALRSQGYFTAPIEEYINGMRSANGKGSFSLGGLTDRSRDAFGAVKPLVATEEPIPFSFWRAAGESLADSWYDSGTIGIGRVIWSGIGTDSRRPFNVTQEDVDTVTKALPGDIVGQRWVLTNATNSEHLSRLLYMKQEDTKRRERLDSYSGSLAATAKITGSLTGSLLSDPTILLPLGQEAVIGKALMRLGKGTAAGLSLSKFAKYSELAATTAGINVAERKFAETYGGYKQDYEAAALVGGLAGAGLGALGDVFTRSRSTQKVLGALDNAESHAIAQAVGVKTPSELKAIKEDILKAHDVKFAESLNSPILTKLNADGKVAVISRKELQAIARDLGRDLPENVKALHKADEGLTLIVKDALKPGDNIDNILAHEIGVHGNLKDTFGERRYNDIKDAVLKRVGNPKGDWLDAVKAVPGGGWEEVLGHWIEKGGRKDEVFKELRRGVKRALRQLGGNDALTDDELADFVKQSLKNEVERDQGFRTFSDGSVLAFDDNIKFSAANTFNPNILSHVLDIEPGATNIIAKAANWVSHKAEASRLYGTYHGILSTSLSKLSKKYAAELLHDPRLRASKTSNVLPIEKQKEHIQRQLLGRWEDFTGTRMDYLTKTLTEQGPVTPGRFQDFNKQIREYYNSTFTNNKSDPDIASREWPPEVVKAANHIKVLRDDMVDIAKRSAEMFGASGKNLLPKEWKSLDDELWRAIDDDRWLTFINKFPTVDKAIDFLEDYAKRTIKRDKIEEKLMKAKTEEYDKAISKYEVDLAKWQDTQRKSKGKSILKQPEAPEKPKVTPEEIEEAVKESARDWAVGVGDQNLSNLDIFKEGAPHELSETLHFLHERVPMDTTVIMDTPFGEAFSYDKHLRSDDLDRIVPMTINRFAGEASIRNFARSTEELRTKRAELASELAKAEKFKYMDATEVQRNLDAFDEGILKIRGLRRERDVRGQLGALVNTLKGISYAQNGSMMGANQLGEMSGSIAYVGLRAVSHIIPAVSNFLRELKVGKQGAALIKQAELNVFGANLEASIWRTDWQSRMWQEASTKGDILRYMDGANTLVNFSSRVVSTISMLPKLTDYMLRGIRRDTITDTFEWAAGKEFSRLRNPFSDKKLMASGLDQIKAEEVKGAINKYLRRDSSGNPERLDLLNWQKEDPNTFFKWKSIVDNQAMRALQQNSVGNTNLLANQNNFTRMMFQFKDFSMKVMNGQLARVFTHHELDDILSLMYGMGTNTMVYAGLTYAKAYARFDDPGKREDYLKDRLSPANLATAAFLRSMVGTGFGLARDIYEAATGSQSFRTTVDRSSQYGKQQPDRTPGDAIGDFIGQFPAIRAAKSVAYDLPKFGYNLTKEKITDVPSVSKRDLRDVFRAFPLQNFIPMVKFSEMLVDESQLPEKIRKR